jgi:putative DNA primase/helicase
VSASTGHCKGPSGRDLLYVFSTSAIPFEAEVSYSRFAAYALLNHRGEFAAATKALTNAGYGISRDEWQRRRSRVRIGGKAETV